jgi:hypothetical protein
LALTENYNSNVFINCPFDSEYKPLLNTIVFTIIYLGYNPRLSLEQSDSGKFRLQKILNIIKESRFGIHDLSRIQASKKNEFFRLNMPFELGADFGCKEYSSDYSDKLLLVLSSKRFDYMQAISDLNGVDIKNHNDSAQEVLNKVREWFIETVGLRDIDAPLKMWYKYSDFQTSLFESKFAKLCGEYDENSAEKIAKDQIKNMTMPEYIDELRQYLNG